MITIIQSYPAPGRGPTGLAYDGRFLWLADYTAGKIFQIAPDTGEMVDFLVCPGNLSGITWDGQWLWQSLHDAGWVRAINPATTDYEATVMVPDAWLSGVAWDGHTLWAASQKEGALLQIEPEKSHIVRTLVAPVAIGSLTFHDGLLWYGYAHEMAFDADYNEFEWLTPTPSYFLVGIDPETGAEKERHELDFLPMGVAWVGDEIWLSHTGGQAIHRARLA